MSWADTTWWYISVIVLLVLILLVLIIICWIIFKVLYEAQKALKEARYITNEILCKIRTFEGKIVQGIETLEARAEPWIQKGLQRLEAFERPQMAGRNFPLNKAIIPDRNQTSFLFPQVSYRLD
jgi:hypothetical protein